jgi:hypothetical protein
MAGRHVDPPDADPEVIPPNTPCTTMTGGPSPACAYSTRPNGVSITDGSNLAGRA